MLWQRPGQCQQHQQRTLPPRGAAAGTNYCAVGAVDIVQAVATAHAVDIVHAVHTLDIAIAIVIVIAKATNTRDGDPRRGAA